MNQANYWELITERRARVAIKGEPGPHIKRVWILIHGYKQLAGRFIQKFEALEAEDCLLVAPEALSRFYLDDAYYGRVGGSWMTKEDRLNEIEDQLTYLDRCLARVYEACGTASPQLYVLGFSQGVATVWRWLLHRRPAFDGVVLWAGKPPEETDEWLENRLNAQPFAYIYGKEDPFIPPEIAKKLLGGMKNRFPELEVYPFQGKHVIHSQPIQALLAHWGKENA
ncbi:MAG: phospholipase [Bacteroidota bacterium]